MNDMDDLARALETNLGDVFLALDRSDSKALVVEVGAADLSSAAAWLVGSRGFRIGSMTVRDEGPRWGIYYHFYPRKAETPWVVVVSSVEADAPKVPSLSGSIHAADWLEREAEDHFGILFEGHPRLGDFVLHDERWQEELAPMRKTFDGRNTSIERRPNRDWRPLRLLHTQGAFSMTVGPVHGGIAEPAHFLLESIGEEIVRAYPRLFYKYRAIEKLAEGQEIEAALLLAERFDALHAFAHSTAYCRAVERLFGIDVPPRAQELRVALSEIERLRSHLGVIQAICGSTGLAVAESQAAILQEQVLRRCAALTGHRYLFGMSAIGGVSLDPTKDACNETAAAFVNLKLDLQRLRDMLVNSSSFLDRLEEVGVVRLREVENYGLVGPVARASGYDGDLRTSCAYEGYESYDFKQASESEGDGYARLRVWFAEAVQSIEIARQALERETAGPVCTPGGIRPGIARDMRRSSFAWVEAPAGAAVHSIWIDERGRVERYRIVPPSLFNWHGFHVAAEGFAFQDFPIILATFGLSVAENDR